MFSEHNLLQISSTDYYFCAALVCHQQQHNHLLSLLMDSLLHIPGVLA